MELTIPSILVRASAMYVIGLVMIRLSGKQSVAELSTMDFIVITILGDAFDTIIYGEQPIIVGVVYFVTITLIHILAGYFSSRSMLFYRLANSPSTLMIQNGMAQSDGMRVERMRPEDVASNIREKGEDNLQEVREARLEPNGKMSVIKQTPSKPVQKQDLRLLR